MNSERHRFRTNAPNVSVPAGYRDLYCDADGNFIKELPDGSKIPLDRINANTPRIVRSKTIYTASGTLTRSSNHVFDSATAVTMTVPDGTDDGEEIRIMNRGAGTATLSGNISAVTSTTSVTTGETLVLVWDSGDGEWQ